MDPRDDEGWRSDITYSQSFADALNENCLASSEWAIEEDEVPCSALCADALTEVVHLGGSSNLHS
jgi:hypothetical protein